MGAPRMTAARGEIRAFPDPAGGDDPLPLLVVQADPLNRVAPTMVGLVVTSRPQRAAEPLTVALGPDDGVAAPAWVKVTQVHTVPAAGAGERLGALSPPSMAAVDTALAEVLALPNFSGERGRAI